MAKEKKRYFNEGEGKKTGNKSEIVYKIKTNKIHKKQYIKKGHRKDNEVLVGSKEAKPKKAKKFPGKAPIPKELLEKHSRGEGVNLKKKIKHKLQDNKIRRKEKKIKFANKQAARAEILLTEDTGFLEADAGETTTQFTQKQIAANVDIAAATKHFELKLEQFGPYRMKYSRNGRHLLLGGKMGHVAAFDWVTKKLHCEINVMESVHDICWLHIETMFASAQKDWVYIYDKKGTELHCVKKLNRVLRMEFLPYHFLLATGSELGYLSWLDISIGEMVGQYRTMMGKISVMKQNPYNAVLCVGQSKGVVSMWSPKVNNPLATMLCHKAPISALAIDPKGLYMATAAVDRSVKVWDIRNLEGPLQYYKLRSAPSHLELSHQGYLAVGMENVVEVYRDCCRQQATRAYLLHKTHGYIGNMSYCPYEDVLGVATDRGFTSLIVPGCGEANFDALESNPYQSKSQRREAEVKSLLEKIQPELIALNPSAVAEIDVPTLKEKIEAKSKLLHLKPQKVDYTPRKKTRRRGTVRMAKNKKIVQETENMKFFREMREMQKQVHAKKDEPIKSFGVLDRFIKKKKH